MSVTYEEYVQAITRLQERHQERLDELGALEMQAEHNFVGYIRYEPDGRFSNEIWRWGVCHGKVFYAETIQAVKDAAFQMFG